MDSFGEFSRLGKVGFGSLAPEHIHVRGVSKTARNRGFHTAANAVETLRRALAGKNEFLIARIDVACEQTGAVGIGSRHQQRRHAQGVRSQPRGDQLLHGLDRRHQHFAAQMPAFLGRGKLVLKMNARRARLDHRLHQFEGIQVSAEARFGVREHRGKPVNSILAFGVMNLIGADQRLIDSPHQVRHTVRRIEALVGIHLPRVVGIGRRLPAADVNRLQPRTDLLNRLVPSHGAQRGHVVFVLQQTPQTLGAQFGQRVLDLNGAPQTHHILGAIRTGDAFPARV